MKEHWPRWVFASFSKHFADKFTASGLPFFVEGDDRDTAELQDFAEFRMDGPRIRELSKGYFRLFVPVNILVQSSMNDQSTHRLHTSLGKVLDAFTDSIVVFKLGATPIIDDGTSLVCMVQLREKLDELRVNHFGQVDTASRIQQASVEGHYEGFITE